MVLAHWMDFSLGKSLVGHSLNLLYLCLCTSYKDTFWIEGLWMGCWPYPYTGSPSWLQEVTISWSIFFTARSLRLRHLHRHPGYSYCPRSLVHTRDSLPCPLPFCLLSLLLYLHLITHNPPLPTLLLSYQIPSFHSSLIDILFPLLRDIQASSHWLSLLLSLVGSVYCSIIILHFMANIHL